MIRDADGSLQRHVGVLFEAGSLGGWGDGALLDRFASGRDAAAEAAFAALVERHGPMVLRVCRAAMGDEHEAHDAFQAVFLVLARKARTVRIRETVGPWLHGVAWRVSARARVAGMRRRRHERRAAEMAARSFEEPIRDGAEAVLHEEVRRLPEAFRAAVVLCDLEGLTTDGAAERLGVPVGTVRSRLYRGRDRLRGRLLRRGIAPAAVGAVVAVPASAATMTVPAALAEATVRLAVGCVWAGAVPVRLAVLMHGGRHAMGFKGLAAVGLSIGLVAGVGGLAAQGPGSVPGTKPGAKADGGPGAATPRAGPKRAESDRERLQGRWLVRKSTVVGSPDTTDLLAVTFRGDRLTWTVEGKAAVVSFAIDTEVSPKTIRIDGIRTPGAPAALWIYDFDGDRLRMACDPGRPSRRLSSFESKDPSLPFRLLELVRDPEQPSWASTTPDSDGPASPGPADLATTRDRLQGTWSVIKVTIGGREADGPDLLLAPMTFRGDTVEFGPFGGVKNAYRYRIDPDGEPRALRVVQIGRDDARPRWWLYELKGDKLRTAAWHSLGDTRRPKGFDAAIDPDGVLVVLELVRDPGPEPPEPRPDPVEPAQALDPLPAASSAPLPAPSPRVEAPEAAPSAEPPALHPPSPLPAPAAAPPAARLEPAPPADPDVPAPASVSPAMPRPVGAPVNDLHRLQGTWTILAQEENGVEAEPDADSTVLIAGNALVLVWGAKDRDNKVMAIEADTFTLAPSASPKRIELTATDPGRRAGPIHGIYRVDGPSLLLCIALDGRPAPTDFDTEPGSLHRLFVLRRKKPGRAPVATPAAMPGMPGGPAAAVRPDQYLPTLAPSPRPLPTPTPSAAPQPAATPTPAPRLDAAPSATPGSSEAGAGDAGRRTPSPSTD